jgi:hypothetical protein
MSNRANFSFIFEIKSNNENLLKISRFIENQTKFAGTAVQIPTVCLQII